MSTITGTDAQEGVKRRVGLDGVKSTRYDIPRILTTPSEEILRLRTQSEDPKD